MARVKRGVTAHAKHKKVLKEAKGYYGRRKNTIRIAKQAVEKAHAVRLSRPQAQEAHLPRALDPAHQRRGARARPHLRPIYRRPRNAGIDVDRKVLADLAVKDAGRLQGARRPGRRPSRRPRPSAKADADKAPRSNAAEPLSARAPVAHHGAVRRVPTMRSLSTGMIARGQAASRSEAGERPGTAEHAD